MTYTVKKLADIAKISVRTLHYYDQIELLKPSHIGDNGYRYYAEEAVLRLQQIRFYRNLDFSLKEIATIIDGDDFNAMQALEQHKLMLEQKSRRLYTLMQTIDKTLSYMKGEHNMNTNDLFEGFDQAKQAEYEEEVEKRWGSEHLKESRKRWKSYSVEKQSQIIAESQEIYGELVPYLTQDPAITDVQAIIARWHENLRYFYEPTLDILLGLAKTYTDDLRFRVNFEKLDPSLPEFLRLAIEHYCQNLENST